MNSPGLVHQNGPTLSAREQEFVARATGTPLLQLDQKKQHHQRPKSAGLVGAIEAREKEKQNMLRGASGLLVQNAVQQRQQQAMQQHMRQGSFGNMNMQMQQNMGMPGMAMGLPLPQQQFMVQPLPPQGAPSMYNFATSPMPAQQLPQGPPSMFNFPTQAPPSTQGYFSHSQQLPSPGFSTPTLGRNSPQQFLGGGPQTFASQQMLPQQPLAPQPYGASWDAQQAAQQQQRRHDMGRR